MNHSSTHSNAALSSTVKGVQPFADRLLGSRPFIKDYIRRAGWPTIFIILLFVLSASTIVAFSARSGDTTATITTLSMISAVIIALFYSANYPTKSISVIATLPISKKTLARAAWWCAIGVPSIVITFVITPLIIFLVYQIYPDAFSQYSVTDISTFMISSWGLAAWPLTIYGTWKTIGNACLQHFSQQLSRWRLLRILSFLIVASVSIGPLVISIEFVNLGSFQVPPTFILSLIGILLHVALWLYPLPLIAHIPTQSQLTDWFSRDGEASHNGPSSKKRYARGWSSLVTLYLRKNTWIVIGMILIALAAPFSIWMLLLGWLSVKQTEALVNKAALARLLPISTRQLTTYVVLQNLLPVLLIFAVAEYSFFFIFIPSQAFIKTTGWPIISSFSMFTAPLALTLLSVALLPLHLRFRHFYAKNQSLYGFLLFVAEIATLLTIHAASSRLPYAIALVALLIAATIKWTAYELSNMHGNTWRVAAQRQQLNRNLAR